MEDVNKGRRILLKGGPQEINSRHIRLHLTFSANRIKRGKVWEKRIQFRGDVLAAVAVVEAKTRLYSYPCGSALGLGVKK